MQRRPPNGNASASTASGSPSTAVVTDPARERFWGGYSGYFHNPDGHLREVAWNPQWTVPG